MKLMVSIIIFLFFVSPVLAKGHSSIKLDYNCRHPGGDYSHFKEINAQKCSYKCEKSIRCKAFDFYKSDHSCWLKDRVYPSRKYQGVVSGVKTSRYSRKTGATTADIDLSYGMQRPGGDYSYFHTKNVQQCALACSQDSKCSAFDYTTSDSFCYLKSWKPPVRKYKGIISGVKRQNSGVKNQYSSQVKSVQELLAQQSYNPGPVDGLMGRKTKIALENYQRDRDLPVTGCIDIATLTTLGLHQGPDSNLAAKAGKRKTEFNSEQQVGSSEVVLQETEKKVSADIQLNDDGKKGVAEEIAPRKKREIANQQSVVTQGGKVVKDVGGVLSQMGEENSGSLVGSGLGFAGKIYTSIGSNIIAVDQDDKSVGEASHDFQQEVLTPEQDGSEPE